MPIGWLTIGGAGLCRIAPAAADALRTAVLPLIRTRTTNLSANRIGMVWSYDLDCDKHGLSGTRATSHGRKRKKRWPAGAGVTGWGLGLPGTYVQLVPVFWRSRVS